MRADLTKLTPEARAEIEAFAAHLRNHPKHARQPGDCRFCMVAETARLRREAAVPPPETPQ